MRDGCRNLLHPSFLFRTYTPLIRPMHICAHACSHACLVPSEYRHRHRKYVQPYALSARFFTLTSPHHDDYGIGPQPRATATMSNTRFKPLFPRAFPVTPESVMPTSTISGTYHVMYQRARAGKPRAWTSDGIPLASSQVWQYYETKEAWNSGAAILGT